MASEAINKFMAQAQKFASDNSPLILTVLGGVGVAGTAILSARAGFKAAMILEERREFYNLRRGAGEPFHKFSTQEQIALTWKQYAAPCGVGLLTVAAVVGSNHIGTSRAAALATAFKLSEKRFAEYKGRVVEKLGVNKEQQVVEAVAKDRVAQNPPNEGNTIIVSTSAGRQLFEDSWSGRYFETTMDDVKNAVNQLNFQLNHHGHASLTDFYDLLGLQKTAGSDEIGWNSDALLDVIYTPVLHDDGQRPVMSIEYRVVPSRDYFRFH